MSFDDLIKDLPRILDGPPRPDAIVLRFDDVPEPAKIVLTFEPEAHYAPYVFTYTNHRGETAERRVVPISVRLGATQWHPRRQWLLKAFDLDHRAIREFAMADIREVQGDSQLLIGAEAQPE